MIRRTVAYVALVLMFATMFTLMLTCTHIIVNPVVPAATANNWP